MNPAPLKRKVPAARGRVEISRTISFVTPMFGGGVHVAQDETKRQQKAADPVTRLRGASIRGQLRFWWRATHGCRCARLEEMREREAAIWGAQSQPGDVSIAIRGACFDVGEEEVYEMGERSGKWDPRIRDGMKEIAYGAFPLQPNRNQPTRPTPGTLHRIKGSADLVLSVSAAHASEVTDALRAWLTFGGIGGRTRRGFGAVHSEEPVDPQALLRTLASTAPALEGISSLARARLVLSPQGFDTGMDALAHGLGKLQKFRQGPNVGRNPADRTSDNKKPAGRSRWPEPEFIRQLTRNPRGKHSERFVGVDKFPRAAFGMPIIFHFHGVKEPASTTLKPAEHERAASPLVIRPYPRADGKIGCLALVLDDPARARTPVVLDTDSGPKRVEINLTSQEAGRIKPLAGHTDPLAAFLKFFASP
jgi:CRISPR-associated protein Cmr1